MRIPTQFRSIKYHIAGRRIEVAGLARPGKNQNVNDVITYLYENQFHTLICLENSDKNSTIDDILNQKNMEYIKTYKVDDFEPPSIASMEGIYITVRNNALNGKKTAIHCTAGLGRTGSILAALKLKQHMLAMSSEDLSRLDITKDKKIELGEYAKNYTKDGTRACTSLVKQSIEEIRLKGGSYNIDYVENEDQVDRLCEYQSILKINILDQRKKLQSACQNSDLKSINELLKKGASPTQEMLKTAYINDNIGVMNALIQGGLVPSAEIFDHSPQKNNTQSKLFLELAISAASLETKFADFARRPKKHEELTKLLTQIRQFSSEWTENNFPSTEALKKMCSTIDEIMRSSLAEHRGLVEKLPMGMHVVANTFRFVCIKIYRYFTGDNNPVYQEGIKGVLQRRDTDTVLKIKDFKDKLNILKSYADPPLTSNLLAEDSENNKTPIQK